MKSFGTERPKTVFAKIVLMLMLLVGVGFADVPKTEIVATGQVKDYVKNLPQQDQKFVYKAIGIGNKFANLYINGEALYDEELEGQWNKRFNPIMTLSGDEWRNIWIDNMDDDGKNGFTRSSCDREYLKEVSYDGKDIKLLYETLVFGMDNYPSFDHYKFIKLNERLIFEVTVGRAMKITNVRFMTKNSRVENKKTKLRFMYGEVKKYESKNSKDNSNDFNELKKSIKNTEEASSICKDY
ncbi:MAG: hypothetical protein PHE67_12110 [Campylobacterales bacterium]|nr:hypothetical protein [Campylobacterales bacterium]